MNGYFRASVGPLEHGLMLPLLALSLQRTIPPGRTLGDVLARRVSALAVRCTENGAFDIGALTRLAKVLRYLAEDGCGRVGGRVDDGRRSRIPRRCRCTGTRCSRSPQDRGRASCPLVGLLGRVASFLRVDSYFFFTDLALLPSPKSALCRARYGKSILSRRRWKDLESSVWFVYMLAVHCMLESRMNRPTFLGTCRRTRHPARCRRSSRCSSVPGSCDRRSSRRAAGGGSRGPRRSAGC